MSAAESIPLSVLLDAVAALRAIKEADALHAFILPMQLYMQLLRATSSLTYYTDRLVVERLVGIEA